jgi:spore coat protein A
MAQLLKFRVIKTLVGTDTTVIPGSLTTITPLDPSAVAQTRDNKLVEMMDKFNRLMPMLNGLSWDAPITENPKLGTSEIWRFINLTPDTHPMHVHLVQFQVLDKQPFDVNLYKTTGNLVFTGPAELPDPNEAGWKDTIRSNPEYVTRIIAKFDGWAGRYVWHCHIIDHEDYEMMRPFDVIP